MSVGIFQNGEYNKVAGNAKDSTAANTTYNNGTSGLQANNVQSAIDEVSAKIGQENISQVGNSVTGAINNLNSNLSSNIIYRMVIIDSVNINQYGYVAISSYTPSIDGYSLLNANIITWSSGLPYNITADGIYLIGDSSTTITNLKIKYIFIRN